MLRKDVRLKIIPQAVPKKGFLINILKLGVTCFFQCPNFNKRSQYKQRNRENRAHLEKPSESPENIHEEIYQLDIHDKDYPKNKK